MPNEFLTFRDVRSETRHPIRLYQRYINKVGASWEQRGWLGLIGLAAIGVAAADDDDWTGNSNS